MSPALIPSIQGRTPFPPSTCNPSAVPAKSTGMSRRQRWRPSQALARVDGEWVALTDAKKPPTEQGVPRRRDAQGEQHPPTAGAAGTWANSCRRGGAMMQWVFSERRASRHIDQGVDAPARVGNLWQALLRYGVVFPLEHKKVAHHQRHQRKKPWHEERPFRFIRRTQTTTRRFKEAKRTDGKAKRYAVEEGCHLHRQSYCSQVRLV